MKKKTTAAALMILKHISKNVLKRLTYLRPIILLKGIIIKTEVLMWRDAPISIWLLFPAIKDIFRYNQSIAESY
jgi:hypothetical protein